MGMTEGDYKALRTVVETLATIACLTGAALSALFPIESAQFSNGLIFTFNGFLMWLAVLFTRKRK